jgi:hypothetical protein
MPWYPKASFFSPCFTPWMAPCIGSLAVATGCYSPNWETSADNRTPEPARGSQKAAVESARSPRQGAPADSGSTSATASVPASAELPVFEGSLAPLPAPCADIPYQTRLAAPDGNSWALLAAPPGFTFDAATGVISGQPKAGDGGNLDLELRDGSGLPRARATFDLSLRRDCWLAYLSENTPEPARLHFRDVFLTQDIVLPAGGSTDAVLDFKFSPDGAWLAFRAGAPTQYRAFLYSTRLRPAAGATLIDFGCNTSDANVGCSVLDYAWSEDSRRLAVVLSGDSAEQDYLSGVDVAETASLPWPLLGQAAWGAESVPLDYHRQLVWVGSSWLGFLGVNVNSPEPLLPDAFYAVDVTRRAEGSVLEGLRGSPSSPPTPGSWLRAASAGLAVVYNAAAEDEEDKYVEFHGRSSAPEEAAPYAFHNGQLSPSGLWIAHIDDDARLQLFDVASAVAPAAQTDVNACSELVAWSDRVEPRALERIACKYGQDIRIFDYSADPPRLEQLQGNELAFEASLRGARRAFSPSGGLLVLSDAEQGNFSLVDVSRAAPSIVEPPLHFDGPAELQMVPDTEAVALSNASALIEYSLSARGYRDAAYDTLTGAPRSACHEFFWEAPESWCGAPRVPGHLVYSGDSKSLLFESAVGTLLLAQPDVGAVPEMLTKALPACGVDCPTRRYSFKP